MIHFCDVTTSGLEHDLPTLVNDRVILPFYEGLNLVSAYFRENKTFAKISPSRNSMRN